MWFPVWLQDHPMTDAEGGIKLGVNAATFRTYRAGIRRPKPDIEKRIVNLTEGKVTRKDLEDLYETVKLRGKKHVGLILQSIRSEKSAG